jgi:ATP-dependent DNA helicase RecG
VRGLLDTPLANLPGIGPVRCRRLAEAGLATVGDLLAHLPHRYEDRRRLATVAQVLADRVEGARTLVGELTAVRAVHTRRRGFTLVRARLADGTGELPVRWFNQPYLAKSLAAGVPYLLHGEVRSAGADLELVNPSCERLGETANAVHGGRVVPVYPALPGFSPLVLRRLVATALAGLDLAAVVPDPLPAELLREHRLPSLGQALAELHRPGDGADGEALNEARTPAHGRLIYGELLELQLALALLKARQRARPKPHRYRIDDRVREAARRTLPFPLTGAQKRVLAEIVDDLRAPAPMLRLLQGEVGSGKTIVAALALVVALESGFQGVFMTPTEILAEQHFRTLHRLLGERYRVGLLTATAAERAASSAALAEGRLQLVVGTHALLQQEVRFTRLGLAVIDEQHRFGVAQRQLLRRKGAAPDLLVMTATPIPRSLALTAYGDLELSVLDELPPGRTPVATRVLPAGRRQQVVAELRRELAAGGRVYAVFPRIDEGEEPGTEAAGSLERLGEELRGELAEFPSAVLHGRLPREEREAVMEGFQSGRIRLLAATTVIEVGVDVPEATVMLIESGERFGLSQLHQLRGRVGRGPRPSRCFVLHGRLTAEGRRRLEAFAATQDGFALAEEDLAIRGPGDLLGTRQAGLPALAVARLDRDREWLEKAREDARRLLPRLAADPQLAALGQRLSARRREP